jgi:hypothetical protein
MVTFWLFDLGFPGNGLNLGVAYSEFGFQKKSEKADMEQVYRFKVALKHQRRLWRRIEVKGTQTLGDLDRIIRESFKYEMWDHLSEFFRGRTWRSEGLGEIQPGRG